ncbi:MAG: cytochrome C oxidase subunit IV family protein, partial [Candidatus Methylomirabilales bacterium]
MTGGRSHPNYVAVWVWLVGLMAASVAVSFLPFPKAVAVFVIFTIAAVKAVLVALNYMHLRYERLLICSLAIVPLLLFFVLLAALFPDIA